MNRLSTICALAVVGGIYGGTATFASEPTIEPTANWTGIYAGVTLGYSELDAGGVFDNDGDKHTAAFGDFDINGTNAGIQIGYNRQRGNIVYGIEADYAWMDISDSYVDGEGDLQRLEADYFATVRARFGAVADNVMVYVTAGAAFSEFNLIVENGTGRFSDDAIGIAYGGGLEWAVSEHIRLKAEYLRLDFDAVSRLVNTTLPDVDNDNITFHGYDVVRIGVNANLNALLRQGSSGTYGEFTEDAADWTGIYAGINIGYSELDVGGIFDVGGGEAQLSTLDPEAINGGITLGYNYQSGRFVYGIEADYVWTDMSDQLVDLDTDTQRVSADWFSTIRARFGVTTGPMLVYLTGGVAFTEVDLDVEINSINNPDRLSTSETGLAYGAGVEYIVMNGVTLKGEFLHFDFDKAYVTNLGSRLDQLNDGDAGDNFSIKGIDVVRIGMNVSLDTLFNQN